MERRLPVQMDGPFLGMIANDRIDAPQGFLSYIQNGYIEDGEVVGRRGLTQIGTQLPDDVQGLYQWDMLDGTQYTVAFANGDLYTYDWGSDTFTQFDLSAEGITLSTTGDVNCCTSRGRLVFTDGVNKPVMVSGPMDGSEIFTTLTAAPVSHRCGVYYDKVFFWDIPGYENEFQWSDEGDPTGGYSGDNQAWEFAQTDAGRILGMAPLNERNVVLKEDSATMLMGSVDENFQTLAVREGLSETDGTVAGGSVLVLNGDVYCLNAHGPVHLSKGQTYTYMSRDANGIDYLRDVWSDIDRAYLDDALGWVDRDKKHVGWLVPFSGDTGTLHKAIVFNTEEPSWSVFDFSGFEFTAVGSVEDADGKEWVLFGDTDGYVYKYRADEAKYNDDSTAIENIFRSRLIGGGQPSVKKRLVELHMEVHLDTDFQGATRVNVSGTLGHERPMSLWGVTGRKRYRRGCNQVGYELGWEVRNERAGETFTLSKVMAYMTIVEMQEDWSG